MPLRGGRHVGALYRALNPVYAREPLSGEGARRFGGRFNRPGRAALYTSLAPETAIRESHQVGALQPTVLVSYRADLGPVLDGRDADALAAFGADAEALADPGWREKMLHKRDVPTQNLAEDAVAAGFVGLLVQSFAKGAGEGDLNLVLWRWSGDGTTLRVVDDEGRLGRIAKRRVE